MNEAKPSKSASKRAEKDLKALGETLIELAPAKRDRLPLGERLRDAIDTASGIRAHGALRRQRQLIGKLLRDADVDAIRRALRDVTRDTVAAKRRFRLAERWRDRLLTEGGDAVGECVADTGADGDALRETLDQIVHARSEKADKTARRALFRLVHEALERSAGQTEGPKG